MNTTSVGGPHLRGMIKQARASGYTFESAMGDVSDGAITQKDSNCCKISTINSLNDKNIISAIKISDNNLQGFKNILNSGIDSPMNWTHESNDHHDNENVSEYGLGWKAGSVNLGDKMTLYTTFIDKKKDKVYYMIILDWNKMSLKNNPECYNPDMIISINKEDFRKQHPFEYGSSIVIESLNRDIVPKDIVSFNFRLKQYVKLVYSHYLQDKIKIYINDELVKPYISPLGICNYPHLKVKYKVWLLWKSSNSDYDIVISKRQDTDPRYKYFRKFSVSNRSTCTSKYIDQRITESEFDQLEDDSCGLSSMFFKGTQLYGFDLNNFKNGSINIRRGKRYITDPTIFADNKRLEILSDPRYSFNKIPTNGENNFHYLELSFDDKKINRLLGQEFTKRLGSNFPDNLLTYTLSQVEKKIRSASTGLGNATSWKNKWSNKYYLDFDTGLSYSENKKLGEKSLQDFKNKTKINYPDADDIKASFIPKESIVNKEIDYSKNDNNINIDIKGKTGEEKTKDLPKKTKKQVSKKEFKVPALVYLGIANYNKQCKSQTCWALHKLPNRKGRYIRCKYGYTCQEIRKREGGSNYSAESLRIIVSYVVNSENDAKNIEHKIKKYVIKSKKSFMEEGKNEYFYLNEKYFKEFQLDFAKLVLS